MCSRRAIEQDYIDGDVDDSFCDFEAKGMNKRVGLDMSYLRVFSLCM